MTKSALYYFFLYHNSFISRLLQRGQKKWASSKGSITYSHFLNVPFSHVVPRYIKHADIIQEEKETGIWRMVQSRLDD